MTTPPWKVRIGPAPGDKWPVREYVATAEQLARMTAAVALALRVLGGAIEEVRKAR